MANREEVRRIVIPLEARLSGGYAEASPKNGNESRSASKSCTPGSGKNTIEVSYDHGGKRGLRHLGNHRGPHKHDKQGDDLRERRLSSGDPISSGRFDQSGGAQEIPRAFSHDPYWLSRPSMWVMYHSRKNSRIDFMCSSSLCCARSAASSIWPSSF